MVYLCAPLLLSLVVQVQLGAWGSSGFSDSSYSSCVDEPTATVGRCWVHGSPAVRTCLKEPAPPIEEKPALGQSMVWWDGLLSLRPLC